MLASFRFMLVFAALMAGFIFRLRCEILSVRLYEAWVKILILRLLPRVALIPFYGTRSTLGYFMPARWAAFGIRRRRMMFLSFVMSIQI